MIEPVFLTLKYFVALDMHLELENRGRHLSQNLSWAEVFAHESPAIRPC